MRHTALYAMALPVILFIGGCHRTETLELPDGTYRGECRDGNPDGYGEFTGRGKTLYYSGEWKTGQKDGYGRLQRGDTVYEGFFRADKASGQGRMTFPDGSEYKGEWLDNRRQGYGEWTTPCGLTFRGQWDADTLTTGERIDGTGRYRGGFNAALQRQGDGQQRTVDGLHYTGQWNNDRRHGWGFAVEPHQVVKCGTWKNDRFQGEQIVYNPNRVYGIDISKYQHGNPNKPVAIDWKNLRITHLGSISKKRIQDDHADYAVSFVYIKASQGLRITNRFYRTDISQGRKHGYACGAYHFFSTDDGTKQARHFLKTACPKRGDLPPMLDVELSDKQIRKMGGAERMFGEIMKWMHAVEQQVKTAPVLYVSQTFVNTYLPLAPAELRGKYQVWVARYGAYKPYVHLLHWQLSPDGRVKGIRGHVDINVYNGTKEQWHQYVADNRVR
ncbi:MAG: hypothetical protein NC388_06295 [Clostridium sp.]|nr:hypothetical protein [Clostridium sp.]